MPGTEPDTETGSARTTLARQQAALVRALVCGDDPPGGFDVEKVAATRQSLLHKRSREAARAWPAMSSYLGDRYVALFRAYADAHPPPPGGPRADGFGFAHHLERMPLPDSARTELADGRAEWAARPAGIRSRRGGVGVTVLRRPWGLFVVVRLPGCAPKRLRWHL